MIPRRVGMAGTGFAPAVRVHVICLADAGWGTASSPAYEVMSRLARRGHRILYLNPPPACRTEGPPSELPVEVQPGVYVVTPPTSVSSRWSARVGRAMHLAGLRQPVAVHFAPGGRRPLDSLPVVAQVDGGALGEGPGVGGWDVRADELIARIHEAEDRAGTAGGGGVLRSGPPHDWFGRRRASLSWKGHAVLVGSLAAGWAYYAGRLCWRALVERRWRPIHRILIVRPRGYLGDLVALLPMLEALRHRFPEAHITLASQPWIREPQVLRSALGIDEVCSIEHLEPFESSTRQLRSIDRVAGAVRLFVRGYDLVISGSTYFLQREPFLSGAPWRIGLDDGHPFQALNRAVVPFDQSRHEADNNRWLAELAGANMPPDRSAAPRLQPPPESAAAAVALRATLAVPVGAPVLTVHPGSKMHSRRWPADRFAALIGMLLRERPDLHVVFSGVAGEAQLIDDIRAMVRTDARDRMHSAAGRTDLTELMVLLADSVALICNDTGSMHVARALGTPIVALMGPENHLRWGPYPRGDAPAVVLRHEVPCAPCRRQRCDALYCLRTLSVEEALAAARQVLDGRMTESTTSVQLWRHSWQHLARAGFEVPVVAAVVFSDDVEDGTAQLGAPARAMEVLRALREQHYPSWTAVFASRRRAAESLRRAIEITAPDLVLPLIAAPQWSPTHLDDDVAVLTRDPAMSTASDGRAGPDLDSRSFDPATWHGVVLRRDALLARLAGGEQIGSTGEDRRFAAAAGRGRAPELVSPAS